jgi:transposase-like protein
MTKKNRNYTAEEKARIALEALKGAMTQAEISSKFAVHTTQIYKWKKQLESNIANVFKDNTVKERSESQLIDELYGKIGKLNIELGWLKKIRTVLQRLNVGLLIAGIQD